MANIAQLTPSPLVRTWDNSGNLAVGGAIYTYQAGTTTPITTYTDAAGASPNTNPVLLNSRGEAVIQLLPGQAYKFVAFDALGNLLWTQDNISLSASSGFITVQDFGATGNGTTDDTAAIAAALTSVAANGGGNLYFLPGTYLISATLTIPVGVSLIGQTGPSLSPVTRLIWGGASNGVMCTTAVNWQGSIEYLEFDAQSLAGTCWAPVSIGGALIKKTNWLNSTNVGVSWSTTTGNSSTNSTFIACNSFGHANVGFQMSGVSGTDIALNTFIGCRFSASGQSLRLIQNASRNTWVGGQIMGGSSSFALVINDTGLLGCFGESFHGVTIQGTASSLVYAANASSSPVSGLGTYVATFTGCDIANPNNFIAYGTSCNVKATDCPGFAVASNCTAPIALTVTASPYTYSNLSPFAQMVVVGGGTVSGIGFVRNGGNTNMALDSGSFILLPGDAMAVTYSVAPQIITYQI